MAYHSTLVNSFSELECQVPDKLYLLVLAPSVESNESYSPNGRPMNTPESINR